LIDLCEQHIQTLRQETEMRFQVAANHRQQMCADLEVFSSRMRDHDEHYRLVTDRLALFEQDNILLR
jgi:hypothetical protein